MKKLILLFISAGLITSCFHNKKLAQEPLILNQDSLTEGNKAADNYMGYEAYYYYTAEATYEEIQIKNSKLVYTYFKDEKGDCSEWTLQKPCWTKENLKTKEANLIKADFDSLYAKLEKTGYWNLDPVIGNPSASEQYYSFKLSFKTSSANKDVLFKSVPGGVPMPDAFRRSRDLLIKLVREKMKRNKERGNEDNTY